MFAAAIAAGIGSGPARAAGQGAPGVVLRLPAGTAQMAEAGSGALARGGEGLFVNPAQAAYETGASASLQRWLEHSTLGSLSASIPMGDGRLAGAARVLDFGSIDEVVPDASTGGRDGRSTGDRLSAREVAWTGGYAMAIRSFAVGASVTYVQQSVADLNASGVTSDAGVAWRGPRDWRVSVAAQQLGGRLSGDLRSQPFASALRASVQAPAFTRDRVTLDAAVEMLAEERQPGSATLALEARWRSPSALTLVARGGARAGASTALQQPYAAGLALESPMLGVEWAVQPLRDGLGFSHRLGLRWSR
ncbi:MAG: hypothetical protein JWO05_363 [Gemmatimonadetes bacterium]|nr:hypothetical protein [Gemmatimonadota bacterium]